ncbi:MAG: CaiB/BaiF CoA transferase family protein, partial [Nocardioidaceae bacterium]
GPYRDRGAFDRVASAYSGLTYVSGEPERPPVRSGYAVIDFMAAYLAAFATVTALYDRDQHGGAGQIIDLALYEAGFRSSENALLAHSALGQVRERLGNRNPGIAPASDFGTADGRRISLHAGTESLFRRLCQVIGHPELLDDARFAERVARLAHQDELYALIDRWVADLDADEAVRILNDAGVPAAPIMSIADIAADPHYRERGTFLTVTDDDYGELPMVAPLPHMSGTPGRIRSLGPELGQHTDEILAEILGLDHTSIEQLRTDGVI